MRRKPPAKAIDWSKVFTLRCKSKSGKEITTEETDYLRAACKADPERYNALDKPVFEATKPFGAL